MLPWVVGGLPQSGIFLLPQHLLHCQSRLAPKARYHVGVGVEGRRDIGMSQKLLDELGMHPLGEKEARTGVPEIMEGDSREPRPFQERPPGTVDEVVATNGCTHLGGKDPLPPRRPSPSAFSGRTSPSSLALCNG